MDETIKDKLRFLDLKNTLENWDSFFAQAKKDQPSYCSFLTNIIEKRICPAKRKSQKCQNQKS